MKYTVTLDIEITDSAALTHYVKSIIPEFGLRAEDVDGLSAKENLGWLYNSGANFPGMRTIGVDITTAGDAAKIVQPVVMSAFSLPGFTPW